jgi:predicted enzyme related to lactoylglutathione lyase
MQQSLSNSIRMSTSFLGLRTLIYKVDDIQQAKDWYTQAFGVQPYFDEPFYVGFNIGGYELGLQPQEDLAEDHQGIENTITEKSTNVAAYWGVEDIAATYERLIALGATAHEDPQDVGGGIKVATLKDPWQNLIGIIYNPHFTLP